MTNLSIDAKYNAATVEMATRIQTREIVLLSYLAVAATLISISVTSTEFRLICLAVPYLSLAASALNAHHDSIIGLLSSYMKKLEENSSSDEWHTDQEYIGNALIARKVRDISAVF